MAAPLRGGGVRSFCRRTPGTLLAAWILWWGAAAAPAQEQRGAAMRAGAAQGGPACYRSKNFVLHTDLCPVDAGEMLTKLESMLALISAYWARPATQPIEMYIVHDLSRWPEATLALFDPQGLQQVREGSGMTRAVTVRNGVRSHTRSVVYAAAHYGVPQHEAVHAYCAQEFGGTGPVWYSEGMAEMGLYWRKDDSSVKCHPNIIRHLRDSPPKSLNEIVNSTAEETGDSWQNYAWRWALCHLLANNPNYSARFRPLGVGLLTRQNVSFEQMYGGMREEIVFEYLFLLGHLEDGFRADLCRWDWKTRFRPLRRGATATVEAGRGWQASGLVLQPGEACEYTTTGAWRTSPADADETDAAGAESGRGTLMGVLFEDYRLGEPFELGTAGTFQAAGSGRLFLRCRDDWGSLADNSGKITVRLRPAR